MIYIGEKRKRIKKGGGRIKGGNDALEGMVLERKKKEAQETSEKNLRIQNQGVFFGEVLRGRRRGKRNDCKQGSSRYVPSYSRNSYPCSILHYSLIILEYSIFADWCGR